MNNLIQGVPYCLIAIYIFVFGLCIGSFLNVAILRGLSGEDMIFARSKCPKCQNKLKWYMNIPLLSYIFLRGKCAFCKCHISIQYPIVEFLNALMYLLAFFAFGLSLKTIFICIFLSLFILLAATDIKETVILDYHAYILLIAGLLYSFLHLGEIGIKGAVFGLVFGYIIFEILARLGYFVANYRMFGEGDSLIALGLGAIFGIKGILIIIAISFVIQTLSAIPILSKKAFDENKPKLAYSYIIVLISMVLVGFINYFSLSEKNTLIYFGAVFVIVIMLIWTMKNIVDELKSKKQENVSDFEECAKKYCLMPFGPALIIASTICIFYMSEIKAIIKNCFF